jgi:serine/threonine-protein kinase
MTLRAGSQLGPFEILAKLGEGGMGEVWRARDSKLGREVALKVLPHSVSGDPDRLARFGREAHLLASLNHPHIAAIYGVEDSTQVKALVLELVEGATLGDRLTRGALSIDETLTVGRQLAEALEAAHEKGIIHRDLKPQNIKVTADGTVKVLDFGLAKALVSDAAASSSSVLMNSPTVTGNTQGLILGTAAYMAPEQAQGRSVDRRADIWAFGVVLWECLTGKRLFGADTLAETLGHVMTRQPDPLQLPPSTPAVLREVIARCLVRDPRRRLQAIGDARVLLEEAADPSRAVVAAAPPPPHPGRLLLPWGIAVAAIAVAVWLATWRPAGTPPAASATSVRTEIVGISTSDSSNVAISPDGRQVIAYDSTPAQPRLLRRSLDSFDIQPVPGTDSGFNPFFSPDGQALAFFANQQLCVLDPNAVSRRCIAAAPGFASGSWGSGGTIVYSAVPAGDNAHAGLWRVSAEGGEPTQLTTIDRAAGERRHVYPQVLPGGQRVLFTIVGEQQMSLAVVAIAGGTPQRVLGDAVRGRYVRSGHVVYYQYSGGRFSAVPFDLSRMTPTGPPVAFDLAASTTGDAIPAFEISDTGTLLYSSGAQFGQDFTVDRVDSGGRLSTLIAERGSWTQPRVSPDGRSVLLRRASQPDCSLWLLDLERRSLQRMPLTDDNHNPLWLPDGERFLSSQVTGTRPERRVLEVRLDGTTTPLALATSVPNVLAESVSPDGRYVALSRDGQRERNDILIADRQTGRTEPLLATDFDEDHPAFSPDGRFLAYAANDSGRSEVYVRPFPGPGAKYLISTEGGTGPIWSRDGHALFYAEGTKLMRVEISATPRFAAGEPRLVVQSSEIVWERARNYDVLPDGSFIVVRRGNVTLGARTLRAVFNWFAELDRLAPAGR